jgi:tetratricopeptide (TPR) repeat protein
MPVHKTKKPVKKAPVKPATGKNGKPSSAKNGRPAKPAPPPPPPPSGAKIQYDAFERAIQLLHKRNFREAKDLFEKARNGPNLEITANAATHVRMCERRLAAPLPEPKSAEEHYDYAIALINLRDLEPSRRHLEIALKMEPRADHVHYAMGVCLALSGDAQGAYDSLKRAIELQPRNRMVARQDSDLEGVRHHPRIGKLLHPEQE